MTIAKGYPMIASDITNLTFMPIGTILMYDGTSWTDNVTLKGWYKCDGNNGTPNLVDRFIRGGTSKGAAGGGTVTLTTANMPSHTHTISGTATDAGSHAHGVYDPGHSHSVTALASSDSGDGYLAGGDYDGYDGSTTTSGSGTGIGIYADGTHSHTLSASATNTGSGTAFDVVPSYYTVIYIRKCA